MEYSKRCPLREKELWIALSFLFVDTEVDFKRLMSVVEQYSVDEVRFALFERVAPVCISNMFSPAPSIWWYFDEEKLVADIELLVVLKLKHGFFSRWGWVMKGWFIRLCCVGVWRELKFEMNRVEGR